MTERGGDRVRLLNVRGAWMGAIRPNPAIAELNFLAWSADGQRLFLSTFWENTTQSQSSSLLVMDEHGLTHVLDENFKGNIGGIAASPDGKHLAYNYGLYENNVFLLEHF